MTNLSKLGPGVHFLVRRADDGYLATLRINRSKAGDGHQEMGFSWHSITHALHRAAGLASRVLSDPAVSSMLPFGAGTAIQVVTKLTERAHNGDLQRPIAHPETGVVKPAWQHLSDPVLRDIAGKLVAAADGKTNGLVGKPITLLAQQARAPSSPPPDGPPDGPDGPDGPDMGCFDMGRPGWRRPMWRAHPPVVIPTFDQAYDDVYGPQPGWVSWYPLR